MEKFHVTLHFTNGEKYYFDEYEAENYNEVANQVTESRDGWFGIKGDIVNLRNVVRCEISELDEDGYLKEEL